MALSRCPNHDAVLFAFLISRMGEMKSNNKEITIKNNSAK
jgi:hypothetical protein